MRQHIGGTFGPTETRKPKFSAGDSLISYPKSLEEATTKNDPSTMPRMHSRDIFSNRDQERLFRSCDELLRSSSVPKRRPSARVPNRSVSSGRAADYGSRERENYFRDEGIRRRDSQNKDGRRRRRSLTRKDSRDLSRERFKRKPSSSGKLASPDHGKPSKWENPRSRRPHKRQGSGDYMSIASKYSCNEQQFGKYSDTRRWSDDTTASLTLSSTSDGRSTRYSSTTRSSSETPNSISYTGSHGRPLNDPINISRDDDVPVRLSKDKITQLNERMDIIKNELAQLSEIIAVTRKEPDPRRARNISEEERLLRSFTPRRTNRTRPIDDNYHRDSPSEGMPNVPLNEEKNERPSTPKHSSNRNLGRRDRHQSASPGRCRMATRSPENSKLNRTLDDNKQTRPAGESNPRSSSRRRSKNPSRNREATNRSVSPGRKKKSIKLHEGENEGNDSRALRPSTPGKKRTSISNSTKTRDASPEEQVVVHKGPDEELMNNIDFIEKKLFDSVMKMRFCSFKYRESEINIEVKRLRNGLIESCTYHSSLGNLKTVRNKFKGTNTNVLGTLISWNEALAVKANESRDEFSETEVKIDIDPRKKKNEIIFHFTCRFKNSIPPHLRNIELRRDLQWFVEMTTACRNKLHRQDKA